MSGSGAGAHRNRVGSLWAFPVAVLGLERAWVGVGFRWGRTVPGFLVVPGAVLVPRLGGTGCPGLAWWSAPSPGAVSSWWWGARRGRVFLPARFIAGVFSRVRLSCHTVGWFLPASPLCVRGCRMALVTGFAPSRSRGAPPLS